MDIPQLGLGGKQMKKLTVLLLVFMLLLGTVSGCAKTEPTVEDTTAAVVETTEATTEEEIITLRIYAQYSDDDTKIPYDYAVAELAKDYPNVKLELDIQAQDDGQKLQTYAATGNLPDIFQVGLT
jgi:raffinose/stachyose/melibiose transport system substrate-binding protein